MYSGKANEIPPSHLFVHCYRLRLIVCTCKDILNRYSTIVTRSTFVLECHLYINVQSGLISQYKTKREDMYIFETRVIYTPLGNIASSSGTTGKLFMNVHFFRNGHWGEVVYYRNHYIKCTCIAFQDGQWE